MSDGGPKYQYVFKIGDNPAGPVHDNWEEAFEDARKAGYGTQIGNHEFKLDDERGARIVRVS